MKQLFFIFFMALVSCYSCSTKSNPNILIQTDIAFSEYSKAHGVNKAFITFAHDSAVILRNNSYPILGKTAIKNLYKKPDSSLQLTWAPSYASIAKSNDLGYTYGIYTLTTKDTTTYGTYVSIWKNTPEGWRYSLDSGNSGLRK